MAHVSINFRNEHPQTSFATRELRHLRSVKPIVFKRFIEASKLSEKQAIAALSQLSSIGGSSEAPEFITDPAIPGYARYPGSGNIIKLHPTFVRQYEQLLEGDLDLEFIRNEFQPRFGLPFGALRTKRSAVHDRARLLMESKLLHEMVHWGRARGGHPAGLWDVANEEGWKFERAAYGKNINATTLGLLQYF